MLTPNLTETTKPYRVIALARIRIFLVRASTGMSIDGKDRSRKLKPVTNSPTTMFVVRSLL